MVGEQPAKYFAAHPNLHGQVIVLTQIFEVELLKQFLCPPSHEPSTILRSPQFSKIFHDRLILNNSQTFINVLDYNKNRWVFDHSVVDTEI